MTAEEWNAEYTLVCANDPAVHGQLLPNPKNVAFLKRVLADGRNQGMSEAAKIVNDAKWRTLNPGEIIAKGDEWWDDRDDTWNPAVDCLGERVMEGFDPKVRRRVTHATPADRESLFAALPKPLRDQCWASPVVHMYVSAYLYGRINREDMLAELAGALATESAERLAMLMRYTQTFGTPPSVVPPRDNVG